MLTALFVTVTRLDRRNFLPLGPHTCPAAAAPLQLAAAAAALNRCVFPA